MKRFSLTRGFFFLTVMVVGVAAIVATSPSPRMVLRFANHRYGARDVCPGENVTISWSVFEGENPRLSTSPENSTIPALDNYEVDAFGSLRLKVLEETTVQLTTSLEAASYDKDSLWFREAPAEICTQFETSPFGTYTGRFDEKAPSIDSVSLGFSLELYEGVLRAVITDLDSYGNLSPVSKVFLNCALEASAFVCRDVNGAGVMTGQLADNVYEGSYEGFATDKLALSSGEFIFVKQP